MEFHTLFRRSRLGGAALALMLGVACSSASQQEARVPDTSTPEASTPETSVPEVLPVAEALTINGTNVVGYAATWSMNTNTIPYSKLTHINISFAECTASGGLTCDTSQINSLVSKAHAAGVKVLISIGGASNGNAMTSAMRNARATLATNIENFVKTWNLDGADIDWEAPSNASDGNLFNALMQKLYADLHPQGKLVTAAVDTGDWFGMFIPSSSFAYMDLMNVMSYDSGGSRYFDEGIRYWTGRGLPKSKLMAGVGFFGNGPGGEKAYSDIVAADSSASTKDSSNGYSYNGIPSMQAKAAKVKTAAGGIMIWELSQDTTGGTSLLSAINATLMAGSGGGGTTTVAPIGKIISLKASANGLFVCADNAGVSPLIANRTTASGWEQFKVVDMGNGNIALQSQANQMFVCAESAGGVALIANRATAGTWESFTWVANTNGTVSLKSLANNQFVCADLGKSTPPNLWANRVTASGWESFTVTVY